MVGPRCGRWPNPRRDNGFHYPASPLRVVPFPAHGRGVGVRSPGQGPHRRGVGNAMQPAPDLPAPGHRPATRRPVCRRGRRARRATGGERDRPDRTAAAGGRAGGTPGRSALRTQAAADTRRQPGHRARRQLQRPGDRFRRRRLRQPQPVLWSGGAAQKITTGLTNVSPTGVNARGEVVGVGRRPLEPGPGRLAVEGRQADPSADAGRDGRPSRRDQRHRPDRRRPGLRRRWRGQPDVG